MTSECFDNFLPDQINQVLKQSKLSLTQIADKIGISKAYLSRIKNNQVSPPLKIALNILRYCKTDKAAMKEYADLYQSKTCKVFSEVRESLSKEFNERLLSEEVALKIASDWDLYNSYHDIVAEKTIHKGELISRYGTSILKKLSFIVERGFIDYDGSNFIINEERYSEFSGRSVFKLLSNAIQNESDQFDMKEHLGTTRFWSGEIDKESMAGLRELKKSHHQEEVAYVNKHIKKVNEGGMRIINLAATTCIQRLLVICALLIFSNHAEVFAGPGQSGGGTDPVDDNVRMAHMGDITASNTKTSLSIDITTNQASRYIKRSFSIKPRSKSNKDRKSPVALVLTQLQTLFR